MTNHLVVFAKHPVPGEVKTRLLTLYTPVQAAEIYRAFILDTLEASEDLRKVQSHIAFSPMDAEIVFRDMISENWCLFPQVGEHLGERMSGAVSHCLGLGATSVVIIGTDIPSLPLHHLELAFQMLKTKDLVLGPSTDGGYYLVGLARPAPEIFQSISWSTDQVFAQTLQQALAARLSLGLLPPWYDVDSPADLNFLLAHQAALSHSGSPSRIPHTQAYLSTLT